ncbi:MAG: hypothetical protein K0S11_1774 [Gammaproteobacteria bacterium]|jgi:uncharacterized protein YycO|nr:hypothetical protein [Gammaproteobacteria bacterium]
MVKASGFKLSEETLKQDRAYICSEYAYACYQSVGITIDYDPSGFITPADFAKTALVNSVSFIQVGN